MSKRAPQGALADAGENHIVIGLNAVIVAVDQDTPYVLSVRPPKGHAARFGGAYGLPYGPFDPERHRTFEIGLRSWVEEQTYLKLGYVEQLYTFGDKGRDAPIAALHGECAGDERIVSVGYLALTPRPDPINAPEAKWRDWRCYFPWEDWRDGAPEVIAEVIEPHLKKWADAAPGVAAAAERWARARLCFGLKGRQWDEEKTLDRYELMYEAGLAAEAWRDAPGDCAIEPARADAAQLGEAMISDHRRILATAIGRLRGKLKYRPIIFELMAETFTLFELQRSVEALCGFAVHKQNFRRVVEKSNLVAATGDTSHETGGRPAARYRFRREALAERAVNGLSIPRPKLGG